MSAPADRIAALEARVAALEADKAARERPLSREAAASIAAMVLAQVDPASVSWAGLRTVIVEEGSPDAG